MSNDEDHIQASIVQFIKAVAPDVFVHAVPNGGHRDKREGARLKWTGVVAGVPDLCITIPGGKVAYIEVKTPSGSLRPQQREFRDWCIAHDVPWALCRSTEAVAAFFQSIDVRTRLAA